MWCCTLGLLALTEQCMVYSFLSLFSNSFGIWFVHLFFFPKISLFQFTFFFAFVLPLLSPILLGKSELDGGLGAVWGQSISPFFRHQVQKMFMVSESGKSIHLSFRRRTVHPTIMFKNKVYLWLFGGVLHLTR